MMKSATENKVAGQLITGSNKNGTGWRSVVIYNYKFKKYLIFFIQQLFIMLR